MRKRGVIVAAPALLTLALLAAGLLAGFAQASGSRGSNPPLNNSVISAPASSPTPSTTRTPINSPTPCPGAHHYLSPQAGAPSNGGTVTVGQRFVLDMMINPGPHYLMGQQAYLAFTHSLLQNVNATLPGCTITSTITLDMSVFDAVIQNEVCNGPESCVFRGTTTAPGSIAFVSGLLGAPPFGGEDFRVAQVAFCATAPGQARLHWEFSPPAPSNRNTEIGDENSSRVEVRACYVDYVINIVPAPTTTPTPTATPCPGACHYLSPQAGAPSNGGTVTVGQRFVLDLRFNSGPGDPIDAHQAYLTFTHSLLQNVDALQADCVITNTVTPDRTAFSAVLQNEVCNGPEPCTFPRSGTTGPGSTAFASGNISQPPVTGDYRVAQIALCATAPGQARLHWEFSPPAPPNRNTALFDIGGENEAVPACYVDYIINIVSAPTGTPTPQRLLIGHVNWQGPPPQPHVRQQLPLTLTLKLGASETNYPSQSTDASGFFTVPVSSLAPGVYEWRVKGPNYLANSGTVALSEASVMQAEMGLMRAGDANDDNLVSALDLNIVRGTFGLSEGQPGYDGRADFTNDEHVNALDFNLLRGNFGLGGAPPIAPGRR